MAGSTREIRRRIRSIGSTRKVTKAMELISSAKMRKASQAVLATRAYADRAWNLLLNLGARTAADAHPLLAKRKGSRIGLVLISTNRGLVGGFNALLAGAVTQFMHEQGVAPSSAQIVLLGKRGRNVGVRLGTPIAAEFEKADVVTHVDEVRPLAKLVTDDFVAGTFDRVILAYTDFVSMIVQKPRVRQLLPLERDPMLGAVGRAPEPEVVSSIREYVFEPGVHEVLNTVLPRLVQMQLYQAVLESTASEHAARMVAMRNASDAANDLIDDLTLSYNQARQAGITQDLSEISASRAALEAG